VATIQLRGTTSIQATAQATVLAGDLGDENSFEKPNSVVPATAMAAGIKPEFSHAIKPRSVTVLRSGTPR
jgi:alpha-L-arabinofuranosidase